MNCTCKDDRACRVRINRGLTPFCQMGAPAATEVSGYTTQEACKAAHPNSGAVRRCTSSLYSGGPRTRRWFPV